jgi:ADP-ribosylglycohydrolase
MEDPGHSAAESRRLRAYQSLEGLSCGDAFGERFFIRPDVALPLIAQRFVPAPPWIFTDDTMMAISIVEILDEHKEIHQDSLARSFATNYDSTRGYGPAMHNLLAEVRRRPSAWRKEAQALFNGEGSFGNGSAMRVAPLGAYFADDPEMIPEQAALSAETTHCHSEAKAGAIAVALASAGAWRFRQSGRLPSSTEFLEWVAQRTPVSAVRKGIEKAALLPQGTSIEAAVAALGNGKIVSCPDTVPFALWCAAHYLDSYEQALWSTVAGLGDRDTTCAIVGGIVVMYAGVESIPKEWLISRDPIPPHMLKRYRPIV